MLVRSMLVFLVACGGGGDGGGVASFIGLYATSSHTHAEMPGGSVACADAGQPVTGTPFFRLDVYSFFEDPEVLAVSNCTDASEASCTETTVSLRAGGPGLDSVNASSQIGGGTMCQLYYTRNQAMLSGTTVQVESLQKYDAPNITASECGVQRALALASSPDCRTVERWAGTRQ
jgi:hypothetical protein